MPKALKFWMKGPRWSLTPEHLLYQLTFQNGIHSVTLSVQVILLEAGFCNALKA